MKLSKILSLGIFTTNGEFSFIHKLRIIMRILVACKNKNRIVTPLEIIKSDFSVGCLIRNSASSWNVEFRRKMFFRINQSKSSTSKFWDNIRSYDVKQSSLEFDNPAACCILDQTPYAEVRFDDFQVCNDPIFIFANCKPPLWITYCLHSHVTKRTHPHVTTRNLRVGTGVPKFTLSHTMHKFNHIQ